MIWARYSTDLFIDCVSKSREYTEEEAVDAGPDFEYGSEKGDRGVGMRSQVSPYLFLFIECEHCYVI